MGSNDDTNFRCFPRGHLDHPEGVVLSLTGQTMLFSPSAILPCKPSAASLQDCVLTSLFSEFTVHNGCILSLVLGMPKSLGEICLSS